MSITEGILLLIASVALLYSGSSLAGLTDRGKGRRGRVWWSLIGFVVVCGVVAVSIMANALFTLLHWMFF